jgi:hypothetical protein
MGQRGYSSTLALDDFFQLVITTDVCWWAVVKAAVFAYFINKLAINFCRVKVKRTVVMMVVTKWFAGFSWNSE